MLKRASGSLAIAAGVLLLAASSASASAMFTVNDTTDAALATSTGTTCVSTHAGTCTLRAAIQAADNLGGAVTITLPAGTYTLTIPATTGSDTDDPSKGDLDIDALNGVAPTVTIAGASADSTVINANSIDRAFTVHHNLSTNPALTVSGVTIEGGAPSSHADSSGYGGAILNDGGMLTILNSMLTGNNVSSEGGAVYTDGTGITVTGSTIAGNSASTAGGGILIDGGVAQLTNDTIDGNSSAVGGGIAYLNQTTGASEMLNVTIAHNSGTNGGGIYGPEYATAIENTIIAANTNTGGASGAGDCYGPTVNDNGPDEASTADAGGNLDSDGTCFNSGVGGDVTSADTGLETLSEANGGPTPTDALDADSPAVFLGRASACPSVDQRGQARLSNACDAGAYQGDEADLAVTASGPSEVVPGATFTDTFTVTNNGPYSATGVTFNDPLPSGVDGSASASQGTCGIAGGTVSCTLGTLTSSQTGGQQHANIIVQLFTPNTGTFLNTGTAGGALDPNAANNSASISTVVSLAPKAETVPTITGDTPPVVGAALTATTGTWVGSGLAFSYQWVRCPGDAQSAYPCPAIAGATGSTYLVSNADAGQTLAVYVTAKNALGTVLGISHLTGVVLIRALVVSASQDEGDSVLQLLDCSDPDGDGSNPHCLLVILLSGGQLNPSVRSLASVQVLGDALPATAGPLGKPHRKTTTYGRRKVTLPAGQRVKVKVTLNRAGQLLLHKLHTLRLRLTISENGQILVNRMVTFKDKKPWKKKSG